MSVSESESVVGGVEVDVGASPTSPHSAAGVAGASQAPHPPPSLHPNLTTSARTRAGRPLGQSLKRRVLVVFSGPLDRPDGLAAELRQLGLEAIEIDKLAGGSGHDIRCDETFRALLRDVRRGAN